MKSYSSREIIKILENYGWFEIVCIGDHHHFKHPNKNGRVTVPQPKKRFTDWSGKKYFQTSRH